MLILPLLLRWSIVSKETLMFMYTVYFLYSQTLSYPFELVFHIPQAPSLEPVREPVRNKIPPTPSFAYTILHQSAWPANNPPPYPLHHTFLNNKSTTRKATFRILSTQASLKENMTVFFFTSGSILMCFLLFVVCISPFLCLIAAIFEKQSFSSLMETLYRPPSPPPSVKSPPMNERTTQKFSVSTLTLLRFTPNLPCFLY